MSGEKVPVGPLLFLVGVHGNELVTQPEPMEGAEVYTANPTALSAGRRFNHENLALAMTAARQEEHGGRCDHHDADPDLTCENELVEDILDHAQQADIVIDLHEAPDAKEDCAYVGPEVDPRIFALLGHMGIRNIVVCETGIEGRLPTAVLIDLAKNSERNRTEYWRAVTQKIRRDGLELPTSLEELAEYRFNLYAHTDLTSEEIRQLDVRPANIKVFDEVPGADTVLGFMRRRQIFALFGGQFEEVVAKLNPDDYSFDHRRGLWLIPTLRKLVTRQ